jgi:hypothetical protein
MKPSFMLLAAGTPPVALGWVAASDIATWETAVPVIVPVVRKGNEVSVEASLIPPTSVAPGAAGFSYMRFDFDLSLTAGGITSTILSFRQLLVIGPAGAIQPVQCAIRDSILTATPTGPRQGQGNPVFVRYTGLHPLLTIMGSQLSVNTEFVDLTELWWKLRKDSLGWYCHPSLGGRQTKLRVLGWTTGGHPMLWFAVVPDALEHSMTRQPPAVLDVAGAVTKQRSSADLVFFRPPPGVNSFAYGAGANGLTDARHDDITLRILARYLLSPIPSDVFDALKASGKVKEADLLADQLQPQGISPAGAPLPPDPMDMASGYPFAFRPVGLESAFNRGGGNGLLLLPLAAGDTARPYEGALLPGLASSIQSCLGMLWNNRAIDRSGRSLPQLGGRELWVAGHSSGNRSMWSCIQKNAGDITRIITFDPSPNENLDAGLQTIGQAVRLRRKLGKTLEVTAIITPNLGQNRPKKPNAGHPFQGLDDPTDLALRQTKAVITVLPAFARRESYWNPLPVTAPYSFVQYLLAKWPTSLLTASAAKPTRWHFLFFHEMAIFGGDLVFPTPVAPGKAQPPRVQTFFEQALGPPAPRPPA